MVMGSTAFMSLKKLKGRGIIAIAVRHNKRLIQAEIGSSGSIDSTRTHLNESLLGFQTAEEIPQKAKQIMLNAGLAKPRRKDAVVGLEVVFSLPPNHSLNDRNYFSDCVEWAANQFGGRENLLSADIHRDEAAPHCHVLLVPLLAGKLQGSAMVGNRQKLLAMQADFHAKVASRHGLQKAPKRLSGTTKSSLASAVLQRLKSSSDHALKSTVWPAIRAAIERDPELFSEVLGIAPPIASKRTRTMAQIFTSKGKGKANEVNTIGFEPEIEAESERL